MNHDIGEIIRAINYAAKMHMHQRRSNALAEPYINHPISLANLLCDEIATCPPTIAEIIASILHDVIEDTEATEKELLERFGPEVLSIVLEVSDDKALPKLERKRLQIANAKSLSHSAKIVKLADKICNLRDMAENPILAFDNKRIVEYFDWCKLVVDEIRGTHLELEKLFDDAYSLRNKFIE